MCSGLGDKDTSIRKRTSGSLNMYLEITLSLSEWKEGVLLLN